MNRIKRFCFVMTVIIAISMGTFSTALATANDTSYSFYNMNEIGATEWRSKDTYTKVYVKPLSGPSMYYTVMGSTSTANSTGSIESGTFLINVGTEASITNNVREHGKTYAKLYYSRSGGVAQVYSTGRWSPDSTRNYTVYG